MGKGSARRPCKVDRDVFDANWRRIFHGKTSEQQEGPVSEEPGTQHQDGGPQAEEALVQGNAAGEGSRTTGGTGEHEEGVQ